MAERRNVLMFDSWLNGRCVFRPLKLEENSNDAFRYYFYSIVNKYFKDEREYGHGEMI